MTGTNDPVAVVDALEQGFSHRMIAVEFGIDITKVEAIAERRRPSPPAPMVGLLLLDARRHMMDMSDPDVQAMLEADKQEALARIRAASADDTETAER